MAAKLLALLMMLLSLGQDTMNAYVDEMNLGGYLFLVNREYTLSSDYVPQDLVKPKVQANNNNILLRADAACAGRNVSGGQG